MSDLSETFIFSHFWTHSKGGRAERDFFLVDTSCVAPSPILGETVPHLQVHPPIFLHVQDYLLQYFFEIESLETVIKKAA